MMKPLSGRAVLVYLVAFFGVIIFVNAVFIAKAVTTFRGEDEPDSYLVGLEYNRTLDRHARQKTLGWAATIAAARQSSTTARVLVTVAANDGAPLSHLALKGELRRPTDADLDHRLSFREAGPGRYESLAHDVEPGVWDVVVETSRSSPFQAERRVWIP